MPYLQYRQEREDKFEKQARQAASERREKEIRDEKYRRIEQSVEHRLNTVSRQAPGKGRLLKKKMKAVKSMARRFERQDEDMTQMPEEESAIFFKLGEKDAAIPASARSGSQPILRIISSRTSRLISTSSTIKIFAASVSFLS